MSSAVAVGVRSSTRGYDGANYLGPSVMAGRAAHVALAEEVPGVAGAAEVLDGVGGDPHRRIGGDDFGDSARALDAMSSEASRMANTDSTTVAMIDPTVALRVSRRGACIVRRCAALSGSVIASGWDMALFSRRLGVPVSGLARPRFTTGALMDTPAWSPTWRDRPPGNRPLEWEHLVRDLLGRIVHRSSSQCGPPRGRASRSPGSTSNSRPPNTTMNCGVPRQKLTGRPPRDRQPRQPFHERHSAWLSVLRSRHPALELQWAWAARFLRRVPPATSYGRPAVRRT